MARPKLYLALCVVVILVELAWIAFHAPVLCLKCGKRLDTPSIELTDYCQSCANDLKVRLLRAVYVPPYPVDPTDPFVALDTTQGTVLVELFAKRAPISTANFLRYAREHLYDDVIFHRVEDYICISGRYRGGYNGEPLTAIGEHEPIKSEASNGLQNRKGTLQLPRLDENPDSATSDYSINLKDNLNYDWKGSAPGDAGYCVFGQVVRGLESVEVLRFVPVVEKPIGPGFERMPREPVKVVRAYEINPVALFGTVATLGSASPR